MTHIFARQPHRVWCLALLIIIGAGQTMAAAEAGALNPGKLTQIDRVMTAAIKEQKLPGAVFWLQHGSNTYARAYGQRALVPKPEAMTIDTIFDAASLTKVVATTPAVMLLVERGKISLDATVQNYIDEFRGGGKETITIRQLMTHTSGLRPDIDTKPAWEGYGTAIVRACAEQLRSRPGTVFRYSDINFFLLGEVVNRVTGETLDRFVAREIFAPLRMTDTRFLPNASDANRIAPTQMTDGEMLRGRVHDPTARYMGGVAGHAGLFTTGADLARYARMLLGKGELDGARVLKPETVEAMTSVQSPEAVDDRRGLGWDIDSGFSRPRGKLFPLGSYGHTGFTGMALWVDPFSQTFWALLSNRVHPDGKGNVLGLQASLATLAAGAVDEFDFAQVKGELPVRRRPASVAAPVTDAGEVLNGIDVLVRDKFAPLKNLRVGLVSNHTGFDRQRRSTIDLLHQAPGVQLKALFSPEHGIRGVLDENIGDSVDEKTKLPVYSLYGVRRAPSPEQLAGLDALVFDIQDIGCRFYTYIATMGNCLEAAGKAKLKFFVLDRANPINGVALEGSVYNGDSKFIAYHALPLRHGMTVGELARMFNAEKKFGADLTVIGVEGWRRSMWFDQTGLPWVNPSPNMRSLAHATLYPGIGLHETALSVGRGTDTPFEVIGAPYIDDVKLAAELTKAGLPGVRFVPVRFTPSASVFKGESCGGVNIIVTDRERLNAVDVGVVLAMTLQRMYPGQYAIEKLNTLFLDRKALDGIKSGQSLAQVKEPWAKPLEEFGRRRAGWLLY